MTDSPTDGAPEARRGPDAKRSSRGLARVVTSGLLGVWGLTRVPMASAHDGSLHTGTAHWVFLGVILVGVSVIVGGVRVGRTRWAGQPRRAITGILVGAVIAMVGTIGLTQIQIEPIGTTPTAHEWYPLLAGLAGLAITTASLVGGLVHWPRRPRYSVLGLLLGGWVVYPVVLPGQGYYHPLGYLLVLAVPVSVGYILVRDVGPVLSAGVLDRFARRVGTVVAVLFAVFVLFSAGLFTVTPEEGGAVPREAFVTVQSFANPLVVWPAVEFYLPSVPLFGALSVGTAVVIGLLAGLIGLDAALLTRVYQQDIEIETASGPVGMVATTGATACCCCGPAVYAVASVVFGVSASPLYWAFIDPASPLGALFFTTAVILLVWSAMRFATRLGESDACQAQTATVPR